MKNECSIIRDILPLYIENMVGSDTISFVEEHLENCPSCQKSLDGMKNSNGLEANFTNAMPKQEELPLKAFKKRLNRKRLAIIAASSIVTAILFLTVSLGFVSYAKLGTFNFPKAAIAFISISTGNAEYVEIGSEQNKVILATPNDSWSVFENYLAENGYNILEEEHLGSLIVVEKDGGKEHIFFSVNRYFSTWQWK